MTIAGPNGTVSVDLNGTAVPGLSRTESLGGDPIGRFEIGNRPTGKRFVLTLDDAVIDDRASAVVQPPSGVQVDASAGAVEVSWTPPAGTAPTAYRVYRDNVLVGTTVAPDTTLTDLEAGDVTRYVYTVVSTVGSQRSDPSSPVVATMPGFVAGDDAVIYAVGDIACKPTEQPTSTTCHHRATSDIAVAGAADAVLALGDLQYEKGQLNNFKNSYDPPGGD